MTNLSTSARRLDSKGRFLVYSSTDILKYLGYYDLEMFELFLSGFKCQWDTIRKISFDILRLFPRQLEYLDQDYKERRILHTSKNVLLSRYNRFI